MTTRKPTEDDFSGVFSGKIKGLDSATSGKQGKTGRTGKTGPAGIDGKNGTDGKDGAPGKDGLHGKDGRDGRDGAPGRDGRDGIDGKNGDPGERGERGEQGIRGERGEQGPPRQPAAQNARAEPQRNRRWGRYVLGGLGVLAVAGLGYLGYRYFSRDTKHNSLPYDKDLVVIDLTEKSKYALRTGDFRNKDLGLFTGYDCKVEEEKERKKVDCSEEYKILLNNQDDKATSDILTRAWYLLNDEGGKRKVLINVEKPYVMKVAPGDTWPVRRDKVNGEIVWYVEPSHLSFVSNDNYPLNIGGQTSRRHNTLDAGSAKPEYKPAKGLN